MVSLCITTSVSQIYWKGRPESAQQSLTENEHAILHSFLPNLQIDINNIQNSLKVFLDNGVF